MSGDCFWTNRLGQYQVHSLISAQKTQKSSSTEISPTLLEEENLIQGGPSQWPALVTIAMTTSTTTSDPVEIKSDFSLVYEGLSALLDECTKQTKADSQITLAVTKLAFDFLRAQAQDNVDVEPAAHSKALKTVFDAVKMMIGSGAKGMVQFTIKMVEQNLCEISV